MQENTKLKLPTIPPIKRSPPLTFCNILPLLYIHILKENSDYYVQFCKLVFYILLNLTYCFFVFLNIIRSKIFSVSVIVPIRWICCCPPYLWRILPKTSKKMPGTSDSTKSSMYYAFPYTYTSMLSLIYELGIEIN